MRFGSRPCAKRQTWLGRSWAPQQNSKLQYSISVPLFVPTIQKDLRTSCRFHVSARLETVYTALVHAQFSTWELLQPCYPEKVGATATLPFLQISNHPHWPPCYAFWLLLCNYCMFELKRCTQNGEAYISIFYWANLMFLGCVESSNIRSTLRNRQAFDSNVATLRYKPPR